MRQGSKGYYKGVTIVEVSLSWGKLTRHIIVDGKSLCVSRVKSPAYQKTDNDKPDCHSDGIIEFKPLSEQPKVIDPSFICPNCVKKYESLFKVSEQLLSASDCPDGYITVKDASEILGLTYSCVSKAAKDRNVFEVKRRVKKIKTSVFVSKKSVENYKSKLEIGGEVRGNWITIQDASRILSLGRSMISQLTKRGVLIKKPNMARVFIDRDSVIAYLPKRRKK